jgi:hypothetical protein
VHTSLLKLIGKPHDLSFDPEPSFIKDGIHECHCSPFEVHLLLPHFA